MKFYQMTLFTKFLIMVVSIVRKLLFGKKGVQSEWCSLNIFENRIKNKLDKIPGYFTGYFLKRYRHPPNKAHPILPKSVRFIYIM